MRTRPGRREQCGVWEGLLLPHCSPASGWEHQPLWGSPSREHMGGSGAQPSPPEVLLPAPPGTHSIFLSAASAWGHEPSSPPLPEPRDGFVTPHPLRHSRLPWQEQTRLFPVSSAEIGDVLPQERRGLTGTHRGSRDSKRTIASPRIKRANESPDLHVIHKAFS